jgi:hypothetical protein
MPVIDAARREAPEPSKAGTGTLDSPTKDGSDGGSRVDVSVTHLKSAPLLGVTGGIQENRPSEVQNVARTYCANLPDTSDGPIENSLLSYP